MSDLKKEVEVHEYIRTLFGEIPDEALEKIIFLLFEIKAVLFRYELTSYRVEEQSRLYRAILNNRKASREGKKEPTKVMGFQKPVEIRDLLEYFSKETFGNNKGVSDG